MKKILGAIKNIFKLNKRSLKYGSNSMILIAVVVAIAVFVNITYGVMEDKGIINLKLDLTSNKLYSLSDDTKNALKKLNKDVTIYGLFDDGKIDNSDRLSKDLMELLKQYNAIPHIDIQYVDPDKNPGLIKSLDPGNIQGIAKGNFVVKCGDKVKKLTGDQLVQQYSGDQTGNGQYVATAAEQAFTGAILYVTAATTPTIYFTDGHSETQVDKDFTMVKDYMQKNNFDVKTINLMTASKVPDDAAILVMASPKSDLSVDEKTKLKNYLDNGGKALFMLDPLESDVVFNGYDDIFKDYNISLNYDKVKENDDQRHIQNDNYGLFPVAQDNVINQNLDPANFVMLMSNARSLNIVKTNNENLTVTSLLKTTASAVGEQLDKSRGADIPGPLDLAVAVEKKTGDKSSKIVVIGNSVFMSDAIYQQYGIPNGINFFLNTLNWMQDIKSEVTILPKRYETQNIQITAFQTKIVELFTIIIFPLIILGLGAFVWLRRRHL